MTFPTLFGHAFTPSEICYSIAFLIIVAVYLRMYALRKASKAAELAEAKRRREAKAAGKRSWEIP